MRNTLLTLFLASTFTARGAVGVDAIMTGGNGTGGDTQYANAATSVSTTGLTVGASATCLVCVLCFQHSSANVVSSLAGTWNGVSLTQRAVVVDPGASKNQSYVFVLVNPAAGANTLSFTWTTSNDVYLGAVSFTGTDTTTCINTANTITATTGTSLAITSTSTGATVATFCTNGGTPTMNFTKVWDESSQTPGGGGSYTLGGTSNSHTFTGAGGTAPTLAGVNVIASGAASPAKRRVTIVQ